VCIYWIKILFDFFVECIALEKTQSDSKILSIFRFVRWINSHFIKNVNQIEVLAEDFIFCRDKAHENNILIIFTNSLAECFAERCIVCKNTRDFRLLFMLWFTSTKYIDRINLTNASDIFIKTFSLLMLEMKSINDNRRKICF